MGDALYGNMLLLGYAWQMGLVPVSAGALDKAIELNGAAVDANRQAFLWGRRAATHGDFLRGAVRPAKSGRNRRPAFRRADAG